VNPPKKPRRGARHQRGTNDLMVCDQEVDQPWLHALCPSSTCWAAARLRGLLPPRG